MSVSLSLSLSNTNKLKKIFQSKCLYLICLKCQDHLLVDKKVKTLGSKGYMTLSQTQYKIDILGAILITIRIVTLSISEINAAMGTHTSFSPLHTT